MAELINLKAARKRREREAAAREAAGNRARFGRTKGQKARDEAEARAGAEKLDGLRLDPPKKD